jgi:hypothetical protein
LSVYSHINLSLKFSMDRRVFFVSSLGAILSPTGRIVNV